MPYSELARDGMGAHGIAPKRPFPLTTGVLLPELPDEELDYCHG